MRKFLVNVIGHQLKGKIVAPFGTEVDESQLMGNADALVKAGFLTEVEVIDEKESIDLDKMTKTDLIDFAKANEFDITENATKAVILDEIEKQILNKEVIE